MTKDSVEGLPDETEPLYSEQSSHCIQIQFVQIYAKHHFKNMASLA